MYSDRKVSQLKLLGEGVLEFCNQVLKHNRGILLSQVQSIHEKMNLAGRNRDRLKRAPSCCHRKEQTWGHHWSFYLS